MLPGEYATDNSARADLYRIALIPERRFRLEDVACIRESDNQRLAADINFENQSVAFAPGIGNRVDCTFQLNALQAAVTAQVVTNRSAVDTTFELEMNGEPVALKQGQLATDPGARPDVYRMALLPVREFRLMDIVCLRDGDRLPANIDFSNQSIAFAPGTGSSVDCTFSLQALKAQVTATARFDAGLPKRQLTFDMNGDDVDVMSGETATDTDANALLYRVALIRQPGMKVTDIACIKDGERLSAITDLNNQSVGFTPGASGSVDCTFTVAGGPVSADPFEMMKAAGITPDASNSSLTIGPDGRPIITLGVPGAGAAAAADNAASPPSTAPADVAACCSCTDFGAGFIAASSLMGETQLPCDFDIPAHWAGGGGSDGLMLSVLAGPNCGGSCTSGAPTMSLSVAEGPNNNAMAQEAIWAEIMPIVGKGQCGEGTVTFYQPPGGVPGQAMGAVRFHVLLGGKYYGATASFSCGGPPDWGNLQELFIDSFRPNPRYSGPE
jgi:hypothetical protein